MKKTLAAVLAAAMALSTATVALATDIRGDADFDEGDLLSSGEYTAKMGDTSKYILDKITMDDGSEIDGSELAEAINDGYLTPTVAVTSNQNKLDGRPVINTGKVWGNSATTETITVKTYKWTAQGATHFKAHWADVEGIDVNKIAEGKEITFVVVDGAGDAKVPAEKDDKVLRSGDTGFTDAVESIIANIDAGDVEVTLESKRVTTNSNKDDALRLSFKINHTYGTDSVTVKMKVRFTVKKVPDGGLELGGVEYKKGDTITSEEMSFKAQYYELSNYYEDMQLTSSEVGANRVLLDGGKLYDAIGAKTFTISFGDDVAIFEGKAAANQKKVNLYWTVDELDEYDGIKAQYPDVDFTFLKFRGNPAPSFQNTGTMYFAAEDKDYQVYSWDGETLEPLNGEFDPTYKVIKVKNIKKLGTYVIADQILEVEEEPEEPAEPVDSTPVAEPDDEGQNPNTGAC